MSFKNVLERMCRRLDGALGAVVIGEDGILVERHTADEAFDTELASVEYVGSCRDIRRAMDALEAGEVEEVSVTTEKNKMLLRSVSPGYFLILILGAGGLMGRGRYELKKASYELAPEFI